MKAKWQAKRGLVVVAATMLGNTAMAQDSQSSLTLNAALNTEYVFRCVSQTNEDPAISAGLDWESADGSFYLGMWGSNVDFGDDARLEIDFYGGYRFETASGTGFDFGLIDYEYFGNEANDNILEGFGSVSRGGASVTLYYDLQNGDYYWLEGGFEHDIGPVTAALTLGTLLPDEGDGYRGWSLGASYAPGQFNYSLTAFGTDSDGEAMFGKVADTRLVFGIDMQF